jgi:two-component system invasion response regulator UvrY
MSSNITVLLVDDHAVVREGYRRLLEESGRIAVVGEATGAAEAYERFCALNPDVVVMDIALPRVSGIESTRRICQREPRARVLVFSMYQDSIYVRRALDAGASGYLTKASAPHVLVEAVNAVAAGRRYLSRDVAQTLALGAPSDEIARYDLSAREFEILKLLAQGGTVHEIATQLGITPKTVANHQSLIKQKLEVETSAQLVHAAIRLGLVTAP